MNTEKILSIIVPCYNEEEVLVETCKRLTNVLDDLVQKNKISSSSYILFVDDGSKDNTWKIIEKLSSQNKNITGIMLSQNMGHQMALIAGMENAVNKCDCLVTIDADLQDDENAIKAMLDEFDNSFEIVYGVRHNRNNDSFIKKTTAECFYKFMKLLGVNIIFNHADYRLISNRVVRAFLKFSESNIFIRGIIPLIGFKSSQVYYERKKRFGGESKFPISKMLSFAWEGITSFNTFPLKIITIIGFLIFFFSFIMGAWVLYFAIFTDKTLQGWPSTVIPIYFIGGIQLLSLGIVGEYIAKIYKEVKRRPRYFIEKSIGFK